MSVEEFNNFPPNMDKNAINFFTQTSSLKPHERMSATQCLDHVWLNDTGTRQNNFTL